MKALIQNIRDQLLSDKTLHPKISESSTASVLPPVAYVGVKIVKHHQI